MSQRVNHQKLRLWVGSFIEFQSHVGSFLSVHHLHAPITSALGCSFQAHSLPLSPYTHILDLEVKEAEANAVRRSGMSRERWDVREA